LSAALRVILHGELGTAKKDAGAMASNGGRPVPRSKKWR
jgi:hypothetical protein